MQKILSISLLLFAFLCSSLTVEGKRNPTEEPVVMGKRNNDHTEYNIPTYLPEVWYDEDGRSLTLEARNVNGFFYLTILEQRTSAVKFNDKVAGAGSRIPLNGYAPGEYRVSLTNPSGCQFIGYFTVKKDIP